MKRELNKGPNFVMLHLLHHGRGPNPAFFIVHTIANLIIIDNVSSTL